jgi:hypothetical protein
MILGKRFQTYLPAQSFAILFLISHLVFATESSATKSPVQNTPAEKLALRDHWDLQSSAKVEATGEVVSRLAFAPHGG